MSYWKQLDRKTLWRSDWLSITLDKIELPDGRVIDNFELMHYPHDTVGIVAVNEKGDVLMVRAYRYLHESFDWEIPGGIVEKDENHVEAVRRELMEETGHTAEIITPMIDFYPHKATCDQIYYLYLAEGLKKTESEIQKVEISETGFHSLSTIRSMIDDGRINESLSLVALLRYLLKKGK